MKDVKDFDVRRYTSEGSASGANATYENTQPSKRSVVSPTSKPSAPTVQNGATGETAQSESSEQSVKPRPTALRGQTAMDQPTELPQRIEPTQSTDPTPSVQPTQATSRVSARHRRASLDEYRAMFLDVPKIIDRQPVFVSHEIRDRIDSVVRRLGGRRMSMSGFLETSNEARAEAAC